MAVAAGIVRLARETATSLSYDAPPLAFFDSIRLVAIGPTTAAAMADYGLPVAAVCASPDAFGVAAALGIPGLSAD